VTDMREMPIFSSEQHVVVNAGQLLLKREEPIVENRDGPILGLDRAAFHATDGAHEFHIRADPLAKGMDVF